MAIGAAHSPAANGLRRLRGDGVFQHGDAEAETAPRPKQHRQIADLVGGQRRHPFGRQHLPAPLAQRFQQAQEILRRTDHAGAAGGVRLRIQRTRRRQMKTGAAIDER